MSATHKVTFSLLKILFYFILTIATWLTEGEKLNVSVYVYRLELFQALTLGGKELELFEEETGMLCVVCGGYFWILHTS